MSLRTHALDAYNAIGSLQKFAHLKAEQESASRTSTDVVSVSLALIMVLVAIVATPLALLTRLPEVALVCFPLAVTTSVVMLLFKVTRPCLPGGIVTNACALVLALIGHLGLTASLLPGISTTIRLLSGYSSHAPQNPSYPDRGVFYPDGALVDYLLVVATYTAALYSAVAFMVGVSSFESEVKPSQYHIGRPGGTPDTKPHNPWLVDTATDTTAKANATGADQSAD